jgi:hypothetical protein
MSKAKTTLALIAALLLAAAPAGAAGSSLLDPSPSDSESQSDGDSWQPLSSLRSQPRPQWVRGQSASKTAWKDQAHAILLQHEKAWVGPTLIHGATPGLMLLAGIADQSRRNPDCFDCGQEVEYAASLAIYFHFSSIIAAATTWLTFGDLHARIGDEGNRTRLIDRLQRTSRAVGIAAIAAGAIAITSAIAFAANSDGLGDDPLYALRPILVIGYVHSGIAAPIFAHVAIANAAFAEQLEAIGDDGKPSEGPVARHRAPRPRLLSASPFGLAVAF